MLICFTVSYLIQYINSYVFLCHLCEKRAETYYQNFSSNIKLPNKCICHIYDIFCDFYPHQKCNQIEIYKKLDVWWSFIFTQITSYTTTVDADIYMFYICNLLFQVLVKVLKKTVTYIFTTLVYEIQQLILKWWVT